MLLQKDFCLQMQCSIKIPSKLTAILQACEFISTLACPAGTVFGVQAAPAKNLAPLPTLPLSLPLP